MDNCYAETYPGKECKVCEKGFYLENNKCLIIKVPKCKSFIFNEEFLKPLFFNRLFNEDVGGCSKCE